MPRLFFAPPEPVLGKTRVHPVFLPFQGCAARCVFCAQPLQSGQKQRPFAEAYAALEAELADAFARRLGVREIAFYGGTFTMSPLEVQLRFLRLATQYREKGLVTKIRASTRPDATPPGLLDRLRDAGLDMLELGVQSFSNAALAASSRGYDADAAVAGCGRVKEAGLELGVQLMPGMPGMRAEAFLRDIAQTTLLAPKTLRLYPCLVLAKTVLADMHAQGKYAPWTLEDTVFLLAKAQLAAWKSGVRVIRMGLAPQAELNNGGILAGPWVPALGSMVRARALFAYIKEKLTALGGPGTGLGAPRRFQGEFWGHKGELKHAYAALGLSPGTVVWRDAPYFEILDDKEKLTRPLADADLP